jgi:hypothetical protein
MLRVKTAALAAQASPDDVFVVVEVLQEHDLTEGALHSTNPRTRISVDQVA